MSVLELVRWHSQQSGLSPALSVAGIKSDLVSYITLASYADYAVHRLNAIQLPQSATIGLRMNDVLLHIVFTLAAEHLGYGTVSIQDDDHNELNPNLVLTDKVSSNSATTELTVDYGWLDEPSGFNKIQARKSQSSHTRRILLTSGTTGKPKAVALTTDMVDARLNSYEYVFGHTFTQVDRLLCCMGLSSSIGYLLLLYCLSRGKMFVIPSSEIGETWRRSHLYNVEAIVASPITLADIWAHSWKQNAQWSGIKLVLTAGGQMPQDLNDRIKRSICSKIINFYGSTESGVVAVANTELLDLKNGESGYIVPDTSIRLLPITDGMLAKDGSGILSILTSANANGYIGGQDTDYFENGAFIPGDIGTISEDGVLAIKGRKNDVVNLGGIKTTIVDIENSFKSAPLIKNLVVFVLPDALGISRVSVFIQPDYGWTEESFWGHCHKFVNEQYWPIRIYSIKDFPITGNSKIDRQALLAMTQ